MDLPYRGKIFSSDGEEIGILHELVIDPRSRVITHIIVQEGLLFTSDRLLATEYIDRVEDKKIILNATAEKIRQAEIPEYRQQEYLPLEDQDVKERLQTPGRIWLRPADASTLSFPYQSVVPPGIGPIVPETEPAIPLDEITLEHGSVVRTSDGKEIGSVEQCRTDEQEKITHILIKEGVFFSVARLIPVDWIRKIDDNQVILSVSADTVQKLD
ncbi:MAG: DUF2171 domain-containing protein [Lentisphaeria bacterium]